MEGRVGEAQPPRGKPKAPWDGSAEGRRWPGARRPYSRVRPSSCALAEPALSPGPWGEAALGEPCALRLAQPGGRVWLKQARESVAA